MEDFKLIYRILRFLNETMKNEEFDHRHFNGGHFSASGAEWAAVLEMLADSGYIKGVELDRAADGHVEISLSRPRITIEGLEYLHGNEFMLKASAEAKGISTVAKSS